MDWKRFVDQFDPMTCVLSMEKRTDGGYGTIRIVDGNDRYIESLALAAGGADVGDEGKTEFVPNSEYTRYIPKDLNFEDICHRAAILRQPVQDCVHMIRYPFDINVTLMPLALEDERLAYCTFSQVLIPKADDNLMAMNISLDTAMDVIKTCFKLRGENHFHHNMGAVIEDIRRMCGAEFCCVLLMDEQKRSCSVLGEAKAPNSTLAWMGTYLNDAFYGIVETWLDTIGGSFCLVIRDEHDMEFIRERNPIWFRSMMDGSVKTLVLFPLFNHGRLLGYIWAENFETEVTERIKNTLHLTASFIASEIVRNLSEGDRSKREDSIMVGLEDDLNQYVSHLNSQADSMITAMASDYRSVYHVDLDRNDGVCYRADPNDREQSPQGVHFPFLERFTWYANHYVTEGYRDGFLNFIDPDTIRASLETRPIIAYRYLAKRGDREYYEMLRMAGVRRAEDRVDHIVHAIGVGFTEIDAEMRETMARNEALAEALQLAEEASRAKTAFLSNMSHEIRTPMNAIIGLDTLALHDDKLTPQTRDYLKKIGDSARHLLGLINDILDMSRIESGRVVLRKELFSFSGMLEQINTMVMSQCSDKGLTYECRILSRVDDFYIGDDTKLKEVLINILSNAVKFTEAPGSVVMTVERTAQFDERSTLKFCIRDTGIGMDRDFIPRIFDSFSQEDSSRKNKYGSTGLGMAITKNLVEMMNGTITVESDKGVGSEFTVVVTLRNCESPEGTMENAVDPARMHALVVDDEEIAAEHARMVLEEAGIRVDVCNSGEEALKMLDIQHTKQESYNLVLMDWRMPGMDGIEATRRIREHYDNATTIMILTAYSWDEIREEALRAGIDGFIAKPLFASSVLSEFERIARRNNMKLFTEKRRADLAGRRILLAEDIEINAEIMMDVLDMKDVQAEHASNGRIAVEMFEKSAPGYYSAILMDVRMPEMDGLEATAAIRALERADAKRIPIIALTANAFDEDVKRSLQTGMNAHLSKPVEPEHLYRTLEELIWEAEQGQPGTA
nr:hypothetical protein [uncultured bacterium]